MIRGIHHVTLVTKNIDEMLRFYTELLGFEKVVEIEWTPNDHVDQFTNLTGSSGVLHQLKAGNAYIELQVHKTPPGKEIVEQELNDAGLRHIGLDIVDVDAEYERLSAAGVRFHSPPYFTPADIDTDLGVKTTFCRDPDGNILEFQEIVAGDESPYAIDVR